MDDSRRCWPAVARLLARCRSSRLAADEDGFFPSGQLLGGRAARSGVEVVADAPLVAGLNRHIGKERLARAAANLDAMHARLELEGRDRRRRALVLAVDVELASG